ncbi:guanylate-binding protein 1-like [Hyperolius riggenbachi]|uniref:guanylate-binding protein 1-like n=1 Tax=Hyperolius riggenbachi TaxID=752182 RepID=UPI0035A3C781
MDEDQVFHEQFLKNTYRLRDEFSTNLKKTLDVREAPPKKHGKVVKKGLDEDEYLTPRQTTYKTDLKEKEPKYIWKDEESVTNKTEGHVRELSYHSLPPYDASHIRKIPDKVKKQEPSRPAPSPPPYPHKSNFTAPEASPSPKSPETYGRQKPSPSVLQRLPDCGGPASEPRRSHGTRPPPVPRKPAHGARLEGPICLIENKEGEKFSVNPEAVNILSMISQPVVVVAIVGMYRTGKSYLMNKLAGAQKGFSLGSTIEAQTKGIWMWCVPHPTKSNHTLVLLDTEGLGDTGKVDTRNDAWIFTLTVLLSSALVYNSKETIDLNALNKLKFVGELAELIKVRSEDKQDNDKDFSRHFPIFIWAVRDFLLELKIEGQLISEDEYLQNALQLKDSGNTSKDAEFNNVRKSIRMFFGNRKCFVFDLPTTNGEHLQRLDEVSEDQLNARFMSQCQTFCDYIFKNAEVKRVQDTVMITGQRLAELAEIYTHAINFSKVACMEEAVLSLSDKENKMAVQEATQYYKKRMDDVPLPTETLDDFLDLSRQHEDAARDIFMRRSFKDKDECFLKEFMGNIQKKKNELYFRNKDKSQQRCRDIIQEYSVNFDKALAEGFYFIPGGHARFKDDLKAIEDQYNKACGSRVKAEEVLQEYLKSKQAIGDTILEADTTLQQIEKEEEVRCQRQKSNERRVKQRQLEDAQEKQKLEEDKAFYMKTYKQLMERMEADRKVMSEKFERVIAEKEREMNISLQQGERGYAMMCQKQIQDLQKEKQLNLSLQKDFYDTPLDSDVMLDAMTGSLF